MIVDFARKIKCRGRARVVTPDSAWGNALGEMGLFSPLKQKFSRRRDTAVVEEEEAGGTETTPLLSAFDGTHIPLVAPRGVTHREKYIEILGRCPPRFSSRHAHRELFLTHLPVPALVVTRKKQTAVASRDPFLDNCKFALILLIGVGHGLQWLLAMEDARVGRGWCDVGGAPSGDSTTVAGHVVEFATAAKTSALAVLPLRALYVWSNAIAIPMFAMLSGRCSRSLAAACAPDATDERRASMPGRIKKTFETLVVPFFTFQLLACVVEASSPALRLALQPRPPPSASFVGIDDPAFTLVDGDGAVIVETNAFNFWTPHLSWYLLALASWRLVLPVAAQMRPGAALALALALGVGVGTSNVGYAVGFFLKFGTVVGNFPYFLCGVLLCHDETYFWFRDVLGSKKVRGLGLVVTMGAICATYLSLKNGAMCFDAWQWEAWKSAPYGDYLFVDTTFPSGTGRWRLGNAIAAPVFRLANYTGSALVGAAFLAVLPRTEVRVVTNMGRKTMYG